MKFFATAFLLLLVASLFSQSADSVSFKTEKQEVKKQKKKTKSVQKKNETTSSETEIISQDTTAAKPSPKTSDYEKDKVRLIMIDATLDLDEAMMEGVKATLDSLDAKNEKLMPFVLHVQDSLSKEIAALKTEKREIETRINPPTITVDTVTDDSDIVIYEVKTYPDERAPERKLLKVISKENAQEIPKKNSELIYDSPSPKNISAEKNEPVHYTTAHALNPISDFNKDTTVALKIEIPNSENALVIKPVKPVFSSQKISSAKNISQSNSESAKNIKAEFYFSRAQNFISEKNYSSAENDLHKAIELYPKYFDAWFSLAQIHDTTGQHQQALKDYQTCYEIDSTQPRLYFNIANSYMKLKQKTEAMHYCNKTLSLAPDDVPALAARADILVDWKDYNAALNDYDHLLRVDRLYHSAYKARGLVKLLVKNFDSAVDDFTRYLIFEESDSSAYYYRGLAKISSNEIADGCDDLSIAAKMGYAAAEEAKKKSCE